MKIIIVFLKFPQSVHHRNRIFRPKNNPVNHIRRKGDPSHLMQIHRISHKNISFLDPVIKPLGIIGWNIRTAAGAYDHGKFLFSSQGDAGGIPGLIPVFSCILSKQYSPFRRETQAISFRENAPTVLQKLL